MVQEPLNDLLKKSRRLWEPRAPEPFRFFCPLCKTERRVPSPPQPGNRRKIIQMLLLSVFTTLVFFPIFGFKGLVSFVPIWTIFEFFYRARIRVHLFCDHCGFDPFLFMTDVQKAKREVEVHWKKKFEEKGIPYPDPKDPQSVALSGKRKKKFEEQLLLTKERERLLTQMKQQGKNGVKSKK